MSYKNKMRIICDPFKKEMKYQWYYYNRDEYGDFSPEYSSLASDDLIKATIQNRAYEIVDVINRECNEGNGGVEIIFVGTNDDYVDLCKVIKNYYSDFNIKCIKDSCQYYKTATEVLPEIEDIFERVKTSLEKYTEDDIVQLVHKYNDVVKPSISLCFIGLYSAGKSAFINSIIGAEVLPSASNPTTAKLCRIKNSNDYKIKFDFDSEKCVLTFKNSKYESNITMDTDIIRELQDVVKSQEQNNEIYHMNATLSIINNYDSEKHIIGDMIEIELPFIRTSLPVEDFDFIIYDTPGSNSKNNVKHFEVLQNSLDEQTNALPIFLTTADTMDAEDNDKIFNLIENVGTALDTTNAITVVNKADEKGPKALYEKRDKINELSITKWKSTRIFFVSSLIGIASKKDAPDEPGLWLDKDMYELYDEKKLKYEKDERKLYEFNIIDKSKVDEIAEYKNNSMKAHMYKNCGLEFVEREIAEYAQHYALYNKCSQASSYLQEAINMCVYKVKKTEQKYKIALDDAKKHFDTKKNELCNRLETKKEDITEYNTSFQKLMEDEFKAYTKSHHIVMGDSDAQAPLREELQEVWKKYKEEEKEDINKEKKGEALSKIQNYVEQIYNDILTQFSVSVNKKIDSFWKDKSKQFKDDCITIVHDSNALTREQKKILKSIVLANNNMDTCRMTFDLRKIGAIRRKKFLVFKLKNETFVAKACVTNIVKEFYDLVRKRITSTESNNEKSFKQWTDDLIDKLVEELCKFNSDLDTYKKKIDELKKKRDSQIKCEKMLKSNQQCIEDLLKIQGGENND